MLLFRNNINKLLYKIEDCEVTCKRDEDVEWKFSGFNAAELLKSIELGNRTFSEIIVTLENE